jgi:hypothetical protein
MHVPQRADTRRATWVAYRTAGRRATGLWIGSRNQVPDTTPRNRAVPSPEPGSGDCGRARQAVAPRALHHSRRRSSAVSGPRGPSSIRASSRNR